jgi:hypothetical protein
MEESMKDSKPKAVDVLGYQIDLVKDDDGNLYVPLMRVCEILGIDHKSEIKHVKRGKVYYNGRVLPVPAKDGKHLRMLCLPVKRMYSWMRGLDHDKVRPEMIQKLLEFRDESEKAISHFVNYGILIDPRVPAEQIEYANRKFLEKKLEDLLGRIPNPIDRRYQLLQTELDFFRKIPYESDLYNNKIDACLTIAINNFKEWLINFDKDAASDSKLLEQMDELRSLDINYKDLNSVKNDLFELCGRLREMEPDLCDQLWQFCCRLHERCETRFSTIINLREDLGCRYYWQISYEDLDNILNTMKPASEAE